MTSLSIQLDEPTRTFVAGDTVEGKVVVTRETGFATPLKFTSFKLESTSELFIRVRAAPKPRGAVPAHRARARQPP